MKALSKDEQEKYKSDIDLFIKLVFEKSNDFPLLLKIVKKVGINTLFSCKMPGYTKEGEIYLSGFEYEMSFLFIALFYESEEVIKFLLENGADPNGTLSEGEPPIWDIQYEYDNENQGYGLRVAKMLLEYGADPNIKWENDEFYYWVSTKPPDIIDGDEEFEYLKDLCDLLEEYGGEFSWIREGKYADD